MSESFHSLLSSGQNLLDDSNLQCHSSPPDAVHDISGFGTVLLETPLPLNIASKEATLHQSVHRAAPEISAREADLL